MAHMEAEPLQLKLYAQEYSVFQTASLSSLEDILCKQHDFINVAVTSEEVSCVAEKQHVSSLDIIQAQHGWRLFKVATRISDLVFLDSVQLMHHADCW
jgi:hypothetical protein